MKVERKETTLEAVRRKEGGREGWRKEENMKNKARERVLAMGKSFATASLAMTCLNGTRCLLSARCDTSCAGQKRLVLHTLAVASLLESVSRKQVC